MIKTCENCGNEFEASRADRMYCGDSCKQEAHRERQRLGEPTDGSPTKAEVASTSNTPAEPNMEQMLALKKLEIEQERQRHDMEMDKREREHRRQLERDQAEHQMKLDREAQIQKNKQENAKQQEEYDKWMRETVAPTKVELKNDFDDLVGGLLADNEKMWKADLVKKLIKQLRKTKTKIENFCLDILKQEPDSVKQDIHCQCLKDAASYLEGLPPSEDKEGFIDVILKKKLYKRLEDAINEPFEF